MQLDEAAGSGDGGAGDALSFQSCVKSALEHLREPAWLGTHSPLAAPYFLGEFLAGVAAAEKPATRGQVLARLITEVIEAMPESRGSDQTRALLTNRFLNGRSAVETQLQLSIGRSTYYRHDNEALEKIAQQLTERVRPAIRLERPVAPAVYAHRQAVVAEAQQHLFAGQSVLITGPAGVGKSSLAAAVSQAWQPVAFVYTFQRDFNDQFQSLIYNLAYYLRAQGMSLLWAQLVADRSMVTPNLALSLIRNDVERLRAEKNGATPKTLLCFDEVDLLAPEEQEEHMRLALFLKGLHESFPLLLAGQSQSGREPFGFAREIELQDLNDDAMHMVLSAQNIALTGIQRLAVQRVTAGNPRLLALFVSMLKVGSTPEAALENLGSQPSVEKMVSRIWEFLLPEERHLLAVLSTFRSAAPVDAFQASLLATLASHQLASFDQRGGVSALPAFVASIRRLLTQRQLRRCHLIASRLLLIRAHYVECMHHLVQAGEYSQAIYVWSAYHAGEIDQGKAADALQALEEIPDQSVADDELRKLVLLRNELRLILGEQRKAEQEIAEYAWEDNDMDGILAREMHGRILFRMGELEQAESEYRRAIRSTSSLLETRLASLQMNLSWTLRSRGAMRGALKESRIAQCEAYLAQGAILADMGNLARGRKAYQHAAALAKREGYLLGEAKALDYLAQCDVMQGRYVEAEDNWRQAATYYARTGNLFRQACLEANRAWMMSETDRLAEGYVLAHEALRTLEIIGATQAALSTLLTIADTCMKQGNLIEAEACISRVISSNSAEHRAAALTTLAALRAKQSRFDDALELVSEAIGQASGNGRIQAVALQLRGKFLAQRGDVTRAIDALHEAARLFKRIGNLVEVEQCLKHVVALGGSTDAAIDAAADADEADS